MSNSYDDLIDQLVDLNMECIGCGANRIDIDKCNNCYVLREMSNLRRKITKVDNDEFEYYMYIGG